MNVVALSFVSPWVLFVLPALPLLWWLIRVTPPAPRTEYFPAIRLLRELQATEETPARTPWWLLALRMLAAALIILAIARPVLDAGAALEGSGPVLLVIDDGWAAAADFPQRMQAATGVLDRAERAGRPVGLLFTAPNESGAKPVVAPPMPAAAARARLAASRPKPWPPDRAGAATAMAGWKHAGTTVVYIADEVAHGADFDRFATVMAELGAVTKMCCDTLIPAGRVLLPPRLEAERLVVRVAQVPQSVPGNVAVLAQSGDGRSLGRVVIALPAGAASGEAAIALPPELRNRLERLVLEGPPSAASVVLLDERWRHRPVGLLAADMTAAEAPLTGPLFYLRRALAPYAELRQGAVEALLARELSVLILADRVIPEGAERTALVQWVEKGGLLIRFAGPRIAEQSLLTTRAGQGDPLLPVRLLAGDRQLGGALSWSQPVALAAFPPASPFAGLAVPDDVRISRQVLAEPTAQLAEHSWAGLADGTPLVTEAARGAGRVVLFHVTANADWSDLPLSGLFVEMLRRLVQISVGVGTPPPGTMLAPAEILDGFGLLGAPPPAARGLAAEAFADTSASPAHPPGLYGAENSRQALNLGGALPLPTAAAALSGARVESLAGIAAERALGPWLMAAGVGLLVVDLLLGLLLRGLLGRGLPRRPAVAAVLALLLLAPPVCAQDGMAALATRLAHIVTGDAQVDAVAKAGLAGLSSYVNLRTAAALAPPDAVTPGQDDLSFYPLLYWPITAEALVLDANAQRALNAYMSRGGIILIDTRGAGSGEGFAPGTQAALERLAAGLTVPPLIPLDGEHVLARSFYLLGEFPGRFAGGAVWVQREQDRANDSVSPVIIGGHDWAAAWAVDGVGRNPYATVPGGARQRLLAYRFGVNLVMYALTGNYKGDQVHVPAILERLGQ